MAGQDEEHEGASVQEQLIEACRRNNTDLLTEIIQSYKNEDTVARLLNETVTVLGNHLYHEAALRGNYEVIDLLLDQPGFECDPTNRQEGDTPLHSAIRWINSEPPAQREFGNALVDMMLEAGSNPRAKNKGGVTPSQLIDPRNKELKELLARHEYALLNKGDFVDADAQASGKSKAPAQAQQQAVAQPVEDEDAEFSGSDEEERAEWERRRRQGRR